MAYVCAILSAATTLQGLQVPAYAANKLGVVYNWALQARETMKRSNLILRKRTNAILTKSKSTTTVSCVGASNE